MERSFRVNSCEQLRFCKYLWALLFSRCVVAFFPGGGGVGKKKEKKKKGKKNTPFKKFIPEMDSPIKALQRAIDR